MPPLIAPRPAVMCVAKGAGVAGRTRDRVGSGLSVRGGVISDMYDREDAFAFVVVVVLVVGRVCESPSNSTSSSSESVSNP